MIYHKIIAGNTNPVDITAACPYFLDYSMTAGRSKAHYSFTGKLTDIDVVVAERECGLTTGQLISKLKSGIYYTLYSGDASISLNLVATEVTKKTKLVRNDKLDADCQALGYDKLGSTPAAAIREFLLNFYWPADLSGLNSAIQIDPTRPRITAEPGVHLRDWPGLRVDNGEAQLITEHALADDGAANDNGLWSYDLGVSQPASADIAIGSQVKTLSGDGKTVAVRGDYALRGPDWASVSDYTSPPTSGIVSMDGGVLESDYQPPRALYGTYEIVSREYLIARCDIEDDFDAGASENAYGYWQRVQCIGPVRPQSDPERYKAQAMTPVYTRSTRDYTSTVYGIRERLFITDGLSDIIGVEGSFPDNYWYFVDNDETLFGPNAYRRALYLPVKTRVSLSWGSGGAASANEGLQKPPVLAYRIERGELSTNLGQGNIAGGDYFLGSSDPSILKVADLSADAEITLDPGWYAIGALGEIVRLNRLQHPTIYDWNDDEDESGRMSKVENRVSSFTLTLEPLEPCVMNRALLDGTSLYCQHHLAKTSDWTKHADTVSEYRSFIYDTGSGAFSEDAAADGQLFYALSGGTVYTIANPRSEALGDWSYPAGCHQGRGVVKIYDGTSWRWVDDHLTASPENQISILENGDQDVEVTGVASDGAGGLLLGVRVREPVLEKANVEVRRVDWDYPDWDGRGVRGGFRVVGDKTELFARGARLRLYVPPYQRGWIDTDEEFEGWYEQTRWTYPLTQTVVSSTYDSDNNRTWVDVDPPPDQASAFSARACEIQPGALQFWDATKEHYTGSSRAQPEVWIEKRTPAPRCELWHITADALSTEPVGYTVVATATESVEETVDFTWDSGRQAYTYEIDRNIDEDSLELDIPHSLNLVDGKWIVEIARRREGIDIAYDAYSDLPYQLSDDYIYQGGKLYRWTGALSRVYSDHGLPAAPLCGDIVEIETGVYAAPVFLDGSTRMVVIDTLKPNYGKGLKPIELDSDSTWQDILDRYRDIGLICNRNSYTFHYPKNAAVYPAPTLDTADVVDFREKSYWADSTVVPAVEYENGTAPASLSVTQATETSTAVNAADARAYRSTLEYLFTEDGPQKVVTARLNGDTLALADKLGYTCVIPDDCGGPTGVLAEVSIDFNAETVTFVFV
jgi:hypothetical protein